MDPAAAKADPKFNLLRKSSGPREAQIETLNTAICGTQTWRAPRT